MGRMPDAFIWLPQGERVDTKFCSQLSRDCSLYPNTDNLYRITITFPSQIRGSPLSQFAHIAELNSPAQNHILIMVNVWIIIG